MQSRCTVCDLCFYFMAVGEFIARPRHSKDPQEEGPEDLVWCRQQRHLQSYKHHGCHSSLNGTAICTELSASRSSMSISTFLSLSKGFVSHLLHVCIRFLIYSCFFYSLVFCNISQNPSWKYVLTYLRTPQQRHDSTLTTTLSTLAIPWLSFALTFSTENAKVQFNELFRILQYQVKLKSLFSSSRCSLIGVTFL